jgi:hypothetical protein
LDKAVTDEKSAVVIAVMPHAILGDLLVYFCAVCRHRLFARRGEASYRTRCCQCGTALRVTTTGWER